MEETPKKPAPGKTDFAKLIDVMESNNKSTTKIEIDGRNIRRHLLEMKNMQKTMKGLQERTLFGFDNFQNMIDSQKLQGMEDKSERMGIFEEIRESLKSIDKNITSSKGGNKKGGGGFFSNMFGGGGGGGGGLGMGMLGAAGGIVALGAAIPAFFGAMAAGDYGLEALNVDLNFTNIKKATIGFSDIITSVPKEGLLALGGLLGIAAFAGNPIKMAVGFSLLGAAIPGFFGGLAIGNSALGSGVKSGYLDVNFETIKAAVAGFAGVMKEFPMDLTGAKVVAVLGIGAAIGSFKGVEGAIGAGVGMSMIGAGIGGFFGGFALGDFAISKLGNLDYSGIKDAVGAFTDIVSGMDGKTAGAITLLLGTGGLVGTFTGFGTKAKVVAGMGTIGAGISAFLLGFSTLSKVGGALGMNGRSMKTLLTNFGEGIGALKESHFKGLAAMMGVAGILALFGGAGAAAGAIGGGIMGILGAGIAAFIVAFDGIASLGGILGVNGSATKTLLTNMADGINALSAIGADGESLKSLGLGLGGLGVGIATFLGAEGIGSLVNNIGKGVGKTIDFIGSFFGGDGKGVTLFESIANSVKPLIDLDKKGALTEFNDLAGNIFLMQNIGTGTGIGKATDAFERLGIAVAGAASAMSLAINGGLGPNQLVFTGMTNDIENATVGLQRLRDSLDMNAGGFTMSASNPTQGLSVGNMSVDNAMLKLADSSPSNNTNVVQHGGDTVRGGDTILVSNSINPVNDSLRYDR